MFAHMFSPVAAPERSPRASAALSRRAWLRATAAASAALALEGCSGAVRELEQRYVRPLSRDRFMAPRVTMDRVVRTVAGLRPFRPSGFVVRAERMDDKLVVHNYGHGGGGLSLSWGSAHLAVREAGDPPERTAAVLGCGVMGLSTARLLQDRGWSVTIYSKALPPHTTSNVAGGLWGPTSVFDSQRLTPAFEARFAEAARVAHHAFQNLVGAGYGVSWIEQYYLSDQPIAVPYYVRTLPDVYRAVADLQPAEHPFPAEHVRRVTTMMIEPAIYLPRLMKDVRAAGGSIELRDFRDLSEVLSLEEPVVFNCTGLGAGVLFRDDELVPIKGQLVFLPPDPEVDYATIGPGPGVMYMFPRRDGILLGGTFERGVDSVATSGNEVDRIVRGHQRFFDSVV